MVDNGYGWYCLYLSCGLGVGMVIVGILLNSKLEEQEHKVVVMSGCERFQYTFSEIRNAFKIKVIYRTSIFFLIMGLIP